MIVGFRHKGLEAFHRQGSTRGIQAAHASRLTKVLVALEAASSSVELALPSFKLHPLKGHWSVWVNGNWRVTFRFSGSDIELVDYLDYH